MLSVPPRYSIVRHNVFGRSLDQSISLALVNALSATACAPTALSLHLSRCWLVPHLWTMHHTGARLQRSMYGQDIASTPSNKTPEQKWSGRNSKGIPGIAITNGYQGALLAAPTLSEQQEHKVRCERNCMLTELWTLARNQLGVNVTFSPLQQLSWAPC